MKKKYKLKKSAMFIIIIFIILIVALILMFILAKSRSYSIEYNIGEFGISENYDSEEKIFYYEITYRNIDYSFIYNHKYINDKKLISNIKTYEDEDYICLILESEYISTNPLCSKEDTLIDYHLVSDKLKEDLPNYKKYNIQDESSYENYKLYDTNNKILIWSYKGFNYINNSNISFIKLFDKDIYDIPHAIKINNFIVIPNYEQEYNFNQVYIINLDDNEVTKWTLDYEISYDSYVLGTNDKSIFIVDNKNKKEYELVPHKQKMRIVATANKQGVVYNDGVLEKVSMKKLTSDNYTFNMKNKYKYNIEDNNLYLSYLDKKNKIKVSEKDISSIVYINDDNVYYLVNDTLYKYNQEYGEIKLITYSEWQYNNKNLIFIND